MDAPRGRYRVLEKDGRLVVIDNETGAPIRSSVAPPGAGRAGRGGASPAGPVAPAGPGPASWAADFLLALAVKRWDEQGRAVIAWEWQENGRTKRWDAALDSGQQKRMGRALLALVAAPLLLVLGILTGEAAIGVAVAVASLPIAWAVFTLRRLHRETNDPGLTP